MRHGARAVSAPCAGLPACTSCTCGRNCKDQHGPGARGAGGWPRLCRHTRKLGAAESSVLGIVGGHGACCIRCLHAGLACGLGALPAAPYHQDRLWGTAHAAWAAFTLGWHADWVPRLLLLTTRTGSGAQGVVQPQQASAGCLLTLQVARREEGHASPWLGMLLGGAALGGAHGWSTRMEHMDGAHRERIAHGLGSPRS